MAETNQPVEVRIVSKACAMSLSCAVALYAEAGARHAQQLDTSLSEVRSSSYVTLLQSIDREKS